MKHTLPEQGKARKAIHRPFEQFELVNLTFYLSVGMHHGESCEHGLFVSFKPLDKTLYFGKSTLGNLLFPVFQSLSFALAHHLPKGLNQGM